MFIGTGAFCLGIALTLPDVHRDSPAEPYPSERYGQGKANEL